MCTWIKGVRNVIFVQFWDVFLSEKYVQFLKTRQAVSDFALFPTTLFRGKYFCLLRKNFVSSDVKLGDLSSSEIENAAKEKDCKTQAVPSTQIDCDAEKTGIRNKEPSPVSTECKVEENGINPQTEHTVKSENCKVSEEGKEKSSTGVFQVKIKEEDDSFPAGECPVKVEEEGVIMEEPAAVKPGCNEKEATCPKEKVEIETKASIQEAVCSKEKAECSQVTQRVRLSIEDGDEDNDEDYVIMTPEFCTVLHENGRARCSIRLGEKFCMFSWKLGCCGLFE
ncbi:uncharacterized protein LOC118201699 isoform X2 [Stegodyphus dumicola]|uniref:uncharacterized protein LOC118201699 isoform X2 n=1 Tax=Stegodyphus dumicola TaxID=202533 RepID=UPI0015B1CDE7|nr:uncharacterized protein LOC118201699 isoform X2 [Stegodyphus dumicola]